MNIGESLWPDPVGAARQVRQMQCKLHQWAIGDPCRRFDDVFNLVYHPDFLTIAWERVAGNKGARTAGVDRVSPPSIAEGAEVVEFLEQVREQLKSRSFAPLPVRERLIPKPGSSKLALRAMSGNIDGYRLGMDLLRLDDVLAEVMAHSAVCGIRIIGVDGPQASGKSTLAGRIASRICAPLIRMDDFVSWVDLVGWWPRFEGQVLSPLFVGGDAHYQLRDWENDEFGTSLDGWKTVEWAPVVVLEGLTCTRAAVADRLADRIWVQAPDEVRLKRGLERDGETHRKLWLDSMITERQFFADDATRTRADIRVNGNPDIQHDRESEIVLLD